MLIFFKILHVVRMLILVQTIAYVWYLFFYFKDFFFLQISEAFRDDLHRIANLINKIVSKLNDFSKMLSK